MTANLPKLLVIEDEAPMRTFLRSALAARDHHVVEATTGREGLAHATAHNPDVILLDLGLPDIDGIELTRRIREWSAVPIIVISARGREKDKVDALDAGADDYLTKPFGVEELLARIRVALRRQARLLGGLAPEPVFTAAALRVDLARRRVFVDGGEVHLTPTEYKLLSVLVRYAGRVVTQRQLLKEVWGANVIAQSHTLRVYMAQLRHKIEAEPARPRLLITEPGVGYRLVDE